MNFSREISILRMLWLIFGCLKLAEGCKRFPKHFIFGAATSAYQIEGAWNVSDKSMSVWDVYTHSPGSGILDGSSGDIAADSYHHYERDVASLKELGVSMYRFSISWTRLMPDGFSNRISKDGTEYYNNLINNLLRNGIEPMVTMNHWDIPETLQKLGGHSNREFVFWFLDYARYVFDTFGDRVKYWITFNEPVLYCTRAYGQKTYAPGLNMPGHAEYLCVHNILLAHAHTYRMYNMEFRRFQNGFVGLCNLVHGYYLLNDTFEDIVAANFGQEITNGWLWNPILSRDGDYPPEMKQYLFTESRKQGYSHSRLPSFTKREINLLKGATDFVGVNFYGGMVFSFSELPDGIPADIIADDFGLYTYLLDEWRTDATPIFNFNPKALIRTLQYINMKYNNPPIIITELGHPHFQNVSDLNDFGKVDFINQHMSAILTSITEDNTRVYGCFIWSLMDCFEWSSGYTFSFGLFALHSTTKERIGRLSSRVYKNIIKTRKVDYNYSPIIKVKRT